MLYRLYAVSHFVGKWMSNFRIKVEEKSLPPVVGRAVKVFFLFLLKVWRPWGNFFHFRLMSIYFLLLPGQEQSTRSLYLGCLREGRVCRWQESRRRPFLTLPTRLSPRLLVNAAAALRPGLLYRLWSRPRHTWTSLMINLLLPKEIKITPYVDSHTFGSEVIQSSLVSLLGCDLV